MVQELFEPTKQQLQAARKLLDGTKYLPEDNIRQNLGRLLDAMGIENVLTYRTRRGPADIYLPRMRVFIEVKSVGRADNSGNRQGNENNETSLEQLNRYVHAEIESELEMLKFASEEERTRLWTGILTDGKIWHAWKYKHEAGAEPRGFYPPFRPNDEKHLIFRLQGLLEGSPIGKPWIPKNTKDIFEGYLPRLHEIHQNITGVTQRATETKYRLWHDMLRTSSMAPDNEHKAQSLFVAHSFLVAIARGVIYALADPNAKPKPKIVLRDGFVAWIIETTAGLKWATDLQNDISSYEWRRRKGDVLRPIYEEFIDDADRKVFGEYYTPDWLAELLVEEILDEDWCNQSAARALEAVQRGETLEKVGVLDPACGSGTFLYHAVQRLMRCDVLSELNLQAPRKAEVIARLVWGLDVHPVAVEIARATVFRALPAIPPDAADAVGVYQGDALMARRQSGSDMFTDTETSLRFETPKGLQVYIPRSFAKNKAFAGNIRRLVQAAQDKKSLPGDILISIPDEDRESLKECHEKFQSIIESEGNSVWSWYVSNITAPLRLSERKVNRIVANPPWVKMAEIQVEERKNVLEAFSKQIGLWDGGRQAPHHDIAQLFVKRCRELYLADTDSDPAAWIVKRTAMHGGHWRSFRKWHEKTGKQIIDLEHLKPFGGGDARKSCVLLDHRACGKAVRTRGKILVASYKDPKQKLEPHMTWEEAFPRIRFAPAPKKAAYKESDYEGKKGSPFRQGATLVPKVLLVLDRVEKAAGKPGHVHVVTAPSNKHPWDKIQPQRGTIPVGWTKTVLTSNDIIPFGVLPNPTRAMLPIDPKGMLEELPEGMNDFWAEMDKLYKEHMASGTNTPKTLLEQLNYRKKLRQQLPLSKKRSKSVVLYPTSADIMRSVRTDEATTIVSHSLFRWTAPSEDEAAYLVAVLNAPCLTQTFVDCRPSGRHFNLYPWRRVPIPRYDGRKPDHKQLAKLAKKAEATVETWLLNPENTKGLGQVGISTRVRKLLGENGIFQDIDVAVRKILPRHASKKR